MILFKSPINRLVFFYLALITITCSPVWAVEYYINQDGSAHVYSAYLMLELLKGNPSVGEIYAFNSISVPNSSGHWLLVLLLNFVSAFTATKIIVTLSFAGFVASTGFLRLRIAGNDGIKTSLLAGAAIGFNWLWFLGFYNFIIGVAFLCLTVGLYYGWRENLNFRRTALLSMLILLTYFSHLVSFAVLAGCLGLLSISVPRINLKRTISLTLLAFVPVVPLIILYKLISAGGGGFYPVWRNLENPLSPLSWISQIRNADPFILLSRKAFPFSTRLSNYFIIFTPIIWLGGAFILLFSITLRRLKNGQENWRQLLPFSILAAFSILTAMFAPDDFGLTNGSILRERFLLCGLVLLIPLFRVRNSVLLKRISQICFGFVILFQTAALWEYSLQTNAEARQYFAASAALQDGDALISIIIPDDNSRFHSIPATGMGNYLGIERRIIARDNYEIGHYLFPIVAKNKDDQRFVLDMSSASASLLNNNQQNIFEKTSKFDAVLEANHEKISKILIWGDVTNIQTGLIKWFDPEPVFESGRVRVFRRR